MLRRHKHKLIDIGAPLFPDENTLRPLLNRAQLTAADIVLNGSANNMWENIIDYAATFTNGLERLITAMDPPMENSELQELSMEMAQQQPGVLAEYLRKVIAEGECVLFIGPKVFNYTLTNTVAHFNTYLVTQLSIFLDENRIFYDPDTATNLSYMIDRYESRPLYVIGDTERFAKEAYEKLLKQRALRNTIHEAIEELHFPLIINTNPDTLLGTLENKNKYIHSWYDISNSYDSVPKIPADIGERTIVYNIYGSFENAFSILFTERETVGFTKSAYKELPPMPPEVINIVNRSHGLFIGFDFKDWHHKILFDVLDLKNKPGNYAICPPDVNIMEHELEYYHRQYNMTFVQEDPQLFLLDLQ